MPGVEARRFDFDAIESEVGREAMNRSLVRTVEEWGPDLVFFFFFTDEFDFRVVGRISARVPTVNWFADDQWRFRTFSRHWAPYLTWVATTDSRAAEAYRRLGFKNVIRTQWACNHYLYQPVQVERNIDISFVGQPHGDRRQVIERLQSVDFKVHCWGYGWETGKLTQGQMIEIFSRSKINLNLSNSSKALGPRSVARLILRKKGGVLVPDWRSLKRNILEFTGKRNDQIKGRNFEIPGCRTFLLTNRVAGLEEYFEIGKEIAVFDGPDELEQEIPHWLACDEEREAIARAGYERTLRDHTYEKRFNEMFQVMGLL